MRILYLTNNFPFPLTSGYLRHYFFIRELSQQHAITLLSIVGPTFATEHAEALKPFVEQVMPFTSTNRGRSLGRKTLNRLRSLFDDAQLDEAVRQMKMMVEQLTQEEQFDLVFSSGKQTLPVIKNLDNIPLVVDLCDAASTRIRGSMAYTKRVRLPVLMLNYLQMRRVEQTLINSAAHMLFASCRDREDLLGQSSHQTTIVPNGVDLDFWQRSSSKRGQNSIVFTGGMNYPPNTDAALYLINVIFPSVQRLIPDTQLFIVGRDPTPQLQQAGQQPNITVTGYVDDIRPFLEQATVFVAPIRYGAGIQNKVLEAMAMEVPVIASPLAADGLRTEAGNCPPIQVAKTAQEFVTLINNELKQWYKDPGPATKARAWIQQQFVWSQSGQKLEQVISSIMHSTTG